MSYAEMHWEGGLPVDLDEDSSDVYLEDPDGGVVVEVNPDRWGR